MYIQDPTILDTSKAPPWELQTQSYFWEQLQTSLETWERSKEQRGGGGGRKSSQLQSLLNMMMLEENAAIR